MKTTKKHYKFFKKQANIWVDKFNLREYEVHFDHENSKALPTAIAWCGINWKGRTCTIGLAQDWTHNKINKRELSKSAFHEVCELLLGDITILGKIELTENQKDDMEQYTHAVIRRLEQVVWKAWY